MSSFTILLDIDWVRQGLVPAAVLLALYLIMNFRKRSKKANDGNQ